MNNRRLVIVAVALLAAMLAVRYARAQVLMHLMLRKEIVCRDPRMTEDELRAYRLRSRQFTLLWRSRAERDVGPELVGYLQDPACALRIRAVEALGRLESPAGERPLLRLMAESGTREEPDEVPALSVRLALARIRARNLHGRRRLDAVAGAAGISFAEVRELCRRVNARVSRVYVSGSPGDQVVQETIDVLYKMGKEGESIRPFAARMTLDPAQKVKLRCASLPLDAEVNTILDFLGRQRVVSGEIAELADDHLPNLGPRAAELVAARLERMINEPASAYPSHGCALLFRAASRCADPRALPLLKRFEKHPDPYVSAKARDAQGFLTIYQSAM